MEDFVRSHVRLACLTRGTDERDEREDVDVEDTKTALLIPMN